MARFVPLRGRARAAAALSAAVLAGCIAAPGLIAAPAAAEPTEESIASKGFTVESLPDGGSRVELRLDEPLPVRDAVPELAVDGRIIGVAKESADGLTLTAETTDAAVTDAKRVDVAWNGVVPGFQASPPKSAAAPTTPKGLARKQIFTDPAEPGPYGVERLDYDLGDTATTLSGLSNLPVEIRAAVYAPAGATGARPVVMFLHGRHSACYNPVTRQTNNTNWPCAADFIPIDSYLGYTETAEALATHGYIVVSISADGINAKDANFTDDNGALARGQLVMQHLDLLAKWNATTGTPSTRHPLSGRLDLTNIGLMGHSRGGEGVVEAALLNADRSHPYGIRAMLPLAPVDFGRPTLPDVPMAVLLPYCDGDVSNQQGQHFFDDTRYSVDDNVLRSSLMIMGADHNFFNSEWTPGVSIAPSSDDWSPANDEVCGSASPTRLTSAEQRAVGTTYMAGFFRLVQGGETAFLPLFDGTNGTAPSAGRAVVYAQAQQPGSRRLDLAPLGRPNGNVSVSGFDLGAYCYSVAARVLPGDTACSSTTATSRIPHWTPATFAPSVPTSPVLRLQWSASSASPQVRVALGPGEGNVTKYDALTLRLARDEAAAGDVDLDVTLVDGAGRSSTVRIGDASPALTPFPASTNTANGISRLGKTWLRTVRLPIASMSGVDLTDVRFVTVRPATATGGAYLSDITFDSRGVGGGGATSAAQISIADATVQEGDESGTATMQLTLSSKLKEAATVQVQTAASGSAPAGQVPLLSFPVTIPKGATAATIEVPLVGNTVVNTASLRYKITISAPTGAVIGDGFAWLTVLDDDTF
jgi:dienelactone hydrolase